jgi:hypothetical protein
VAGIAASTFAASVELACFIASTIQSSLALREVKFSSRVPVPDV